MYAQELPGWEEQKMEKRVEEVLLKEGIELILHSNHTLIDPLELPFTLPRLPEIFTEFRKKVERESRILEDAGELSTFKGSSFAVEPSHVITGPKKPKKIIALSYISLEASKLV